MLVEFQYLGLISIICIPGARMDKTLLKGLQVLELVVGQSQSVRSSLVATELGLAKSNAHRVLKTLEHAGYIRQDPDTREFVASLKLWEMGFQIIERLDLRKAAAPLLQDLAQETGEAVHLSVLDHDEVIYIDKIDSPQPIGTYTRTGGRAPAYCVATGKALLAELDDTDLAPILANLQQHNGRTITDPEALRTELRATRARGYSINRGEWRESVWGLATVVRDSRNHVIAAVGVSGPDFRLSAPERLEEMSVYVRDYAGRISRAMGWRG